MIEWINFSILLISVILAFIFYRMSVKPVALEQKIGDSAYKKCTLYRTIGGIFWITVGLNYILYFFYPLPIPSFRYFPWHYWISLIISLVIFIPAGFLTYKGYNAAGRETAAPTKEQKMFGGIYNKIRHPQLIAESFIWLAIGFLLHSPFLVIFSFVWFVVIYFWARSEEEDLILRYGESYVEYRKKTGMF